MSALFENSQWVVTEEQLVSEGVEAPFPYQIPINALMELRQVGEVTLYEWPLQLCSKTWVDQEAFFEAFEEASAIHSDRLREKLDMDKLAQTKDYIAKSRRYAVDRR